MHRLHKQTALIDGMVAAGMRAAVVLIGLLLAAGCTHPRARTQATPAEPVSGHEKLPVGGQVGPG